MPREKLRSQRLEALNPGEKNLDSVIEDIFQDLTSKEPIDRASYPVRLKICSDRIKSDDTKLLPSIALYKIWKYEGRVDMNDRKKVFHDISRAINGLKDFSISTIHTRADSFRRIRAAWNAYYEQNEKVIRQEPTNALWDNFRAQHKEAFKQIGFREPPSLVKFNALESQFFARTDIENSDALPGFIEFIQTVITAPDDLWPEEPVETPVVVPKTVGDVAADVNRLLYESTLQQAINDLIHRDRKNGVTKEEFQIRRKNILDGIEGYIRASESDNLTPRSLGLMAKGKADYTLTLKYIDKAASLKQNCPNIYQIAKAKIDKIQFNESLTEKTKTEVRLYILGRVHGYVVGRMNDCRKSFQLDENYENRANDAIGNDKNGSIEDSSIVSQNTIKKIEIKLTQCIESLQKKGLIQNRTLNTVSKNS